MAQEKLERHHLYSPSAYQLVLIENNLFLGSIAVVSVMFGILYHDVYFAFFKQQLPVEVIVMVSTSFWFFLVLTVYIAFDWHKKRLSNTFPLLSEVLNVGFKMQAATQLSDSIVMTLDFNASDQVSVLPYLDPDIAIMAPYAYSFRQLVVITQTDDYLVTYNSNYQVVKFKKI